MFMMPRRFREQLCERRRRTDRQGKDRTGRKAGLPGQKLDGAFSPLGSIHGQENFPDRPQFILDDQHGTHRFMNHAIADASQQK